MKTNDKTAPRPSWKNAILLAITALALCASPAVALADTCPSGTTCWTGTTGSWFTDGNWSNHVPNCTTDAQINNSGTAQVSSPLATASAKNLYLGYNTADSGNVSVTGVNGGSLSICGSVFVAYQGTGSMTVTNGGTVGGAVATSGDVSIASLAGQLWVSNGSAKVDGTGSTWTVSGEFDVGGTTTGAGGTGLLTVTNGGTVSAASAHVWNSGTLTGNGTVSATTASGTTVDGTLEPSGTPPNDTLTISGTGGLLLHSGAATVCNVVPSGADNVQVSSGAATLNGRLVVTMTGNFTAGTTYTLLHADTALRGTFSSVSINYPCECFKPEIQYDYVHNNVNLYLKPAACCQ